MTPHHAYSAFIERALRHTEALGNGRTHQLSPRWTRLLTLMVVLLCMAGAACSRPEPSPLRVGTNIWPGYEPLYVARHWGYLDTNQVRLVEFTSTSQILRAFRNGAIDAACVTLDEALLLAQEAADVRLVLVFDISNGADVIMAKPEIADLKDLKGRRVGSHAGLHERKTAGRANTGCCRRKLKFDHCLTSTRLIACCHEELVFHFPQILVNLIRNAKYACRESVRADKRLALRVATAQDRLRISVIDNGVGIAPENLTRIFAHGFTTRKDGHGFGLHSGVLAAQEMGGSLRAHSEGIGHGATFTLELPLHASEPAG